MAVSHANCTHPRTPAGRRACRNSVRAGGPVPASVDYIGDHIRATAAKHAIKAKMDRRYDKVDRIQPRRSGARVNAGNSTCVQAALHTRGRCACGWENWAAA